MNTSGFPFEINGVNVDIEGVSYSNRAYSANIIKNTTTSEYYGTKINTSGTGNGTEIALSYNSLSTGVGLRYGMNNLFGSFN